ncbi:MAG: hypothetical protein AAF962_26920 [Actinomycetota bacterium]
MPDPGQPVGFPTWSEATERVLSKEDPVTKHLLSGVLMSLVRENHSGEPPIADVDVDFVLRAVRGFVSRRDLLQRILDGEDLGWFDD